MLVACGRADAEKLEYAMSQYTGDVPFKADVHFDALVTEARLCLVYFCFFLITIVPTVCEAVAWEVERTSEAVERMRNEMLDQLSEADKRLRKSGVCRRWFGNADQEILDVAGKCNGHLFEQLLIGSSYTDVDCVNLLRKGN